MMMTAPKSRISNARILPARTGMVVYPDGMTQMCTWKNHKITGELRNGDGTWTPITTSPIVLSHLYYNKTLNQVYGRVITASGSVYEMI